EPRGPAPATAPSRDTGSMAFPPGRSGDADTAAEERERRQKELARDEELAAQLCGDLRLTSPAEHGAPCAEAPLPRVGDGALAARAPAEAARGGSLGPADFGAAASCGQEPDHTGISDGTHSGVEYHAMDSDGDDAFLEPPRTNVMGTAQVMCRALTTLVMSWRSPPTVPGDSLTARLG
ncbi:unnamed protein product, partial [Prorocentrum cordatum]